MPRVSQYDPGTFCWQDLGTTDVAAARAFYGALFGWTFDEGGDPQHPYSLAQIDGLDVCGLYSLMPEQLQQGVPPHWLSYISCDNVGDTTAQAEKNGGRVVMGPMDVMDKGRMSLVMDPTGAMVAFWQPLSHCGASLVGDPGTLCWNELLTNDTNTAGAFYSALFGWARNSMAMPGMDYTIFAAGEVQKAGLMAIMPEMGPVPPHWMVYFAVANCDAACDKAAQLGGRVCQPSMDIPGVGRMAMVMDPQGAMFSVIHLGGSGSGA